MTVPPRLLIRRSVSLWLAGAVLVLSAASAPGSAFASRTALASIHGYRRWIAPALAQAGLHCRFTVTCSHYGEVVIARDGLLRGTWRTLRRVARCGPWTPDGTRDDP